MTVANRRFTLSLSNGHAMQCELFLPARRNEKRAAVIAIHDIFGLTDDIRRIASRLADAGYPAVVPDLYDNGSMKPLCVTKTLLAHETGKGLAFEQLDAVRQWPRGDKAEGLLGAHLPIATVDENQHRRGFVTRRRCEIIDAVALGRAITQTEMLRHGLAQARAAAGGQDVAVGGASTVRQYLAAGLLDDKAFAQTMARSLHRRGMSGRLTRQRLQVAVRLADSALKVVLIEAAAPHLQRLLTGAPCPQGDKWRARKASKRAAKSSRFSSFAHPWPSSSYGPEPSSPPTRSWCTSAW